MITDRVDIVSIVSEHVRLKRSGRRFVGLCPFHSEKTPSFTVNPELGIFKCFGCGKGGDVFSFVQLRENVPFAEAMRMLADRAGVTLETTDAGGGGGAKRTDIAKVNDWALRHFRRNLQDEAIGRGAREYVRKRGFSDEITSRFGLGLAVDDEGSLLAAAKKANINPGLLLAADLARESEDNRRYETFRNRLMFPIRDATGRIVGFGGRTLGDDRAKYLNTRQTALFDKGRGLYGIDQARTAMGERGRAVVVEGYTDCLAVVQAGFPETVATLGTALTDAQVDLLRRYTDEVIFLFDSDDAGEAAADRAIRVALPRCVKARLARIPDGKDPDEYLSIAGPDAFSDVLNRAVDALEFKWSRTLTRFEGDTADSGRRDAVLDFVRVVAEAADARAVDAIQRGLLVNQVAHLLRMNRAEVDRLVRRVSPAGARRRDMTSGPSATPRTVPPDREQAAWTHLLEVLLNESGLMGDAGELPDHQAIADRRDRQIAEAVRDLHRAVGEFRLSDVLARFSDEVLARRVTELAERGAARGNFESTFRLALQRVRSAAESRILDQRAAGLDLTEPAQANGVDDEGKPVLDGLMGHRHFAPRRLLRQTASVTGTAADETAVEDRTVEQR